MRLIQFGVAALLALGICIPLFDAVTARYPDTRPHVLRYNLIMPYVITMLQHENPELYPNDLILGDHALIEATHTHSPIYMWVLAILHKLAAPPIDRAIHLYYGLLIVCYIPGMYLLFQEIGDDIRISAIITLISIYPSHLIATPTYWGFDPTMVLPFSLFTALSPWPVWFAYRYWYKPSTQGQIVAPWIPFALGLGMGFMLIFIHGISSIAFIGLMSTLSFVQALRGKLSWKSLAVFLTAIAITGLIVLLQGHINKAAGDINFTSAESITERGQRGMIFPWQSLIPANFDLAPTQQNTFLALLGYTVWTLFFFVELWRHPRNKLIGITFVFWCGIWLFVFMNVGYLVLVLMAYGAWRVWLREADDLDALLALTVCFAFIQSYFLQAILYYLWQHFQIVSLTGILYEAGRFSQLAYIPFYLLLARATLWVIRPWDKGLWSIPILSVWAAAIYHNLDSIPFPRVVGGSYYHGGSKSGLPIIMLLLGLSALLVMAEKSQWKLKKQHLLIVLLIGTVAWWQIKDEKLTLANPSTNQADVMNPDYLVMTQWVRQNTDQDSLFHIIQPVDNFRYYAQRSLLTSLDEFSVSLYAGKDPLALRWIRDLFYMDACEAQRILEGLRRYKVDYVVDRAVLEEDCQHIFTDADEAIIFQNDRYIIYDVSLIPDQWPQITQALATHAFDLIPDDALIFNPATGQLAEQQTLLSEGAAWIEATQPPSEVINGLLDWMTLIQRMTYQTDFNHTPALATELSEWRKTKDPIYLHNLGVGYLIYHQTWAKELTEAEINQLLNPNQYRLIQTWDFPQWQETYWLLEVQHP